MQVYILYTATNFYLHDVAHHPHAQVDNFLLALMEVPQLRARATLLAFRAGFVVRVEELESRITLLAAAAAELHASTQFRMLSTIVTDLASRFEDNAMLPAAGATSATVGILTLSAIATSYDQRLRSGSGGTSSAFNGHPSILHLALDDMSKTNSHSPHATSEPDVMTFVREASRMPALNSLAGDVESLVKDGFSATAAFAEVSGRTVDENVGGSDATTNTVDTPMHSFVPQAARRLAALRTTHTKASSSLITILAPSDEAERRLANLPGAALLAVYQLHTWIHQTQKRTSGLQLRHKAHLH